MSDILLYAGWIPSGFTKIGEINYDKEIHLHVDQTPKDLVTDNIFRIIVILEPFESLKNIMIDYFNNHKDCYSYIFTYHQDILDSFKNSILSNTPTSWVHGYIPINKEFSVSSVFGNKHLSTWLPKLCGYLMRWELFTRREEIEINKKFYLSSTSPLDDVDYSEHLILGESKNPMFNSQFHIAIENTGIIRNTFSEKLVDCFQTKTIPIYYGASNIGDFFNTEGILIANSVSEIIDICNNLNENTYDSMLNEIEENYNLSMSYKNMEDSLIMKVKKILNI